MIPSEESGDFFREINSHIKDFRPDTGGKQVSVIVVGAGGRGTVYARIGTMYPESVKIAGVSDIVEEKRLKMQKQYGIPDNMLFGDYHELFKQPKLADAVIISTPDDVHYEPCILALKKGYDVLLEKPVAPTERECRAILRAAKKYGRIVAVCHVLRYAPYFIAMRETIRSGVIGDVVSVQHMEPILYSHMAHSYVRGSWRNSKTSTPIILAKSCHDLDIMRWLIGKPCKSVSAEGSLYLFRKEMAPEGAALRCTDDCPLESTCPYSAIDIYVRKQSFLWALETAPDKDHAEEILNVLKTSKYGRCVWHCDNDQPDHYIANMTFEDGVTGSFNMEAFTPYGGRRTRIMGTKGYIDGDMTTMNVIDFRSRTGHVWSMDVPEVAEYKGHGHGGGDFGVIRDFVEAVAAQDPGRLTSTIDASIESHVIGFAAEKSRLGGRKVKIKM